MSYSPLSKPSVVAEILGSHDIDPKYSFGQNFLVNDQIIGKILRLANVQAGDLIVEVGPGLGVLTIALLNAGAHVIAIEKDSDMISILSENVDRFCPDRKNNLKIVECDALDFDFSLNSARDFIADGASSDDSKGDSPAYKFVSNLPYAVAATIILNAFQQAENLQSLTAMVQKEVGARIAANKNSKNYGAYTVKLSMYSQFVEKFDVSPNSFFPPPRVTSSVVHLNTNKKHDKHTLDLACLLADAAFFHRRKTINNSIRQYFEANSDTADNIIPPYSNSKQDIAQYILDIFTNNGIDTSLRAEMLSPQDYLTISDKILNLRLNS